MLFVSVNVGVDTFVNFAQTSNHNCRANTKTMRRHVVSRPQMPIYCCLDHCVTSKISFNDMFKAVILKLFNLKSFINRHYLLNGYAIYYVGLFCSKISRSSVYSSLVGLSVIQTSLQYIFQWG